MPTRFPTYKKRGEWVEQLFLAIVLGLGLNAARPLGDSATYDAIVERRSGRLVKVQVKSVSVPLAHWPSLYRVACRRGDMLPYSAREIDYIAAYVIPQNMWYILPVRALRGKSDIIVRPADPDKTSRYTRYREAWRLLS